MSEIYTRQKQNRDDLQKLWERPDQVNVIHYSCESFYDRPDGTSPRITSIVVRNLHTAQTKSFSIHKYGELEKHSIENLEENYDDLEKKMLEEFFEWAKEHKEYKWLHWNMRDENYGFHALELRFKILEGEPHVIQDANKFDLARILIGIYGKAYIGHPRLENIYKLNEISSKDFKSGEEEAKLFEQKNYVALHQSTLAKADIIANLCQLAFEGKIKTNASWGTVHGHGLRAVTSWLSQHPVIVLFSLIAGPVGIASALIQWYLCS